MRIVTRHEIFGWIKEEHPYYSSIDIEDIFRTLTDEDLAAAFGFEILRKGYFIV